MSQSLQALQQRFQNYILGHSENILQDIISTDSALAEHRLAAYYNAYRLRLIECLQTDYPVLEKELGEEEFISLVLAYLEQYPSDNPSARWAGKNLPEFLQQTDDFLGELAHFEWSKGLTFDAKNPTHIVTIEDMGTIDPNAWPQLTFSFQPAIRLLDFHWNIPPYWQALESEASVPEKQHQDIATVWLLWRKDHDPHWRSLEVAEAWGLDACMKGANFATLCAGLTEWISETEVAITAASYLKQWIQDQLITEIHN